MALKATMDPELSRPVLPPYASTLSSFTKEPGAGVITIFCYSWGNGGAEILSNSSEVTQQVRGRTKCLTLR